MSHKYPSSANSLHVSLFILSMYRQQYVDTSVLPHLLLCHRCYLDLLPSDGHNIQLHAHALPTLMHARMHMHAVQCKYPQVSQDAITVTNNRNKMCIPLNMKEIIIVQTPEFTVKCH